MSLLQPVTMAGEIAWSYWLGIGQKLGSGVVNVAWRMGVKSRGGVSPWKKNQNGYPSEGNSKWMQSTSNYSPLSAWPVWGTQQILVQVCSCTGMQMMPFRNIFFRVMLTSIRELSFNRAIDVIIRIARKSILTFLAFIQCFLLPSLLIFPQLS